MTNAFMYLREEVEHSRLSAAQIRDIEGCLNNLKGRVLNSHSPFEEELAVIQSAISSMPAVHQVAEFIPQRLQKSGVATNEELVESLRMASASVRKIPLSMEKLLW